MPLSRDNITDYVSGGELDINGFAEWNTSYNCWVFNQSFINSTTPSDTSCIINLNLQFTSPYDPDFTREYEILPLGSGYGNIYVLGHGSTPMYYGQYKSFTTRFNVNDQTQYCYLSIGHWHRIKEIFSNGVYELYINDSLATRNTISTVTDPELNDNTICVSAGVYTNGVSSVKFGLRNLRYYGG